MKISYKRILSFAMALALILGMIPAIQSHVHAATTTDFSGSTVADLVITATDATGSGSPTASWTATGTTLEGSLVGGTDNSGFYKYYYESTTTLTLKNNKTEEAELSFKYSVTTSGSDYGDITVNGTKYTASASNQSVSVTLAAGGTVTVVLHVPQRRQALSLPTANGASITITDLALVVDNSVSVNFGTAANGSYTVTKADGTAVDTSATLSAQSTDRYTLTATPATGYAFSGWYFTPTGGTETFYSGLQTATDKMFTENGVLVPKFVPTADGVWGVGGAVFDDYANAISAAVSGADKTVVLLKDYTLTGSLTVPAGVTLLIPFDAAHTVGGADPEVLESPSGTQIPSVYRTLTMADGATITVNGNLEVGAKHHASHGGSIDGGVPYDYYGHISMNGSSAIVVENGGSLFAWGYVTGSDTASVTAKSGAKIYEKLQVSDYRGGNITSAIVLDNCFPFNQYYIQNVEVKETLEYGATLIAHAGIYGNGVETSTVDFMGSDSAMFTMAQGTTITKYYDAATDRLIVDANGDVSMNAISIMGYDTSAYILPFNHNITVNIKSGTATINQDIMLQPGATINVDQGASLTLASGKKIILMDASDWGNFCFGKQLQQISYVPSKGGAPNIRQANSTGAAINMGDAKLNINGTFNVNGQVYASVSGAQIVSVGKTGVINFTTAAPTASTTFKQSSVTSRVWIGSNTEDVTVYPALLTNGDATTINTNGIAANTTYNYCAICDCWYTGTHVFEITWNVNGATSTSEVHAGKTVSYPGTTPTKAPDASGHYTFSGWATSENGTVLSTIPAATTNVTYYAVFTSASHDKATVTDGKHYCSVCGYLMGSCTDVGFDHTCDVGGETMTTCVDDNKDHVCDYDGCKLSMGTHADGDDANHTCDYCNGDVGESCYGGTATCMAAAVCAECGQSYGSVNSANHTGNNTTGVGAKDATCTAEGYTGDTVCECGTTVEYGTTIEKLAHTPNADDGDCTTDITCSVCGTVTTEGNASHTPNADDGDCTTDITCSVCGTVTTEGNASHTPNADDGDCTTDITCSVCGTVTTEGNASHNSSYVDNGDGTHDYVCTCGTVEIDNEEHTYTDGTCACGAEEPVTNITVVSKGVDTYTVSGNVVTVTYDLACKVGYLVDGSYVAIEPVANEDGSYSFTAPEGVTEVLLVVKGDVNGSGTITNSDKTKLNAALLGKTTLTAEAAFAIDVNDSNTVTNSDKTKLNAFLLGKTTIKW